MLKELDDYYQHRFQMFASTGWTDFIQDVTEMEQATNRISGVTLETLAYKQGELAMLNWLLGLEELSQKAYEDLNAPL